MNFKKIKTVKNVATYEPYPDILVYDSNDDARLLVNFKNIGVKEVGNYHYYNQQVFYNLRTPKDSFVYNCTDGSIDLIKGERFNRIVNEYLIYRDNENLYHYKNDLFVDIFVSKFKFSIMGDNYGIAYNQKSIIRSDFNDNILWDFPLSTLGVSPYKPDKEDTVYEILGIAHGNLWFYTRGYRLVALNLETGELVKAFTGTEDSDNPLYERPVLVGGVFFNEQTQNIVGISSNSYTEIDTKTLMLKEYYNYIEADPCGIGKYERIYNPILHGDYFTFLGKLKDDPHSGLRRVGIFDHRARKLVWEYEVIEPFEKERLGIELISPEPPYMAGNKLYVKDRAKRLHIFEREEE